LWIKGQAMPTISMFFGLVIRMYYAPKEHNPPHIHALNQEQEAVFNISTGEILEGRLPVRHTRFVQAWVEIHKEELLADWLLCQNGEEPLMIDPLK
jgi:hypothetical protein